LASAGWHLTAFNILDPVWEPSLGFAFFWLCWPLFEKGIQEIPSPLAALHELLFDDRLTVNLCIWVSQPKLELIRISLSDFSAHLSFLLDLKEEPVSSFECQSSEIDHVPWSLSIVKVEEWHGPIIVGVDYEIAWVEITMDRAKVFRGLWDGDWGEFVLPTIMDFIPLRQAIVSFRIFNRELLGCLSEISKVGPNWSDNFLIRAPQQFRITSKELLRAIPL
jgi:hypothetical protein